MKNVLTWIAVLAVAGVAATPVAMVWAQEKDEVPARATWRPQAPERPDLPPGVKRDDEDFKVERPSANLPGLEEDVEALEDTATDSPDDSEISAPREEQPEAGTGPGPQAEPQADIDAEAAPDRPDAPGDEADSDDPLRESRVESPAAPASVEAPAARSAGREPPAPIPGATAQPEYPRDALLEGEEGYVSLEFTVTSEGDVVDVVITDAEPRGVFERTVRQTIRRWRFEPATQDGEPVSQRVRHRFDFNLDG